MSSPELLFDLIRQRVEARQDKQSSLPIADVEPIEKEIAKLRAQEDRYNKAYGAELFSLEQLKEYTVPIRNHIAVLESQIRVAGQEETRIAIEEMPNENEIRAFAEEMSKTLINLSFEAKRAIVRSTVEKIIGTQQQLQVIGAIPIPSIYVEHKTISRHRRPAKRWKINAF